MAIVIEGIDKPKNCYNCWFNNSDCHCSITKGEIDRDDYSCSKSCPIESLPPYSGLRSSGTFAITNAKGAVIIKSNN